MSSLRKVIGWRRRALVSIAVLTLAGAAGVLAQQQSYPPAGSGATSTVAPPLETISEQPSIDKNLQNILEERPIGEVYNYDPQGRRDPFRSLIGPSPKINRENAPPGVPGFMIEEIDLTGVIRKQQGYIAMIKGPDNLGYTIQAGAKLFDGQVVRITPDSVVFRQEINDPTRVEKFREVVKQLSSQTPQRR